MRIRFLTRHPIQSKYLFIVMMSMLCPTLFLASCIYFLIFRLMAEQLALPEGIHAMLVPVFYRINLLLIIVIPAMMAAVFLWGLFVSHRFAGPIERIERQLDEALSGRSKGSIKLRAGDDLSGVAERINRLISRAA